MHDVCSSASRFIGRNPLSHQDLYHFKPIFTSRRSVAFVPDTFFPPEAKGHSVERGDFLEHQGDYNRIIMNPPFDKGADIEHVRHAFSLLAPDGKLVAIMSEGPFFRNDTQATEFRNWLDEVAGISEQLPEDAFNNTEAFRKTGVRTRIVTITK